MGLDDFCRLTPAEAAAALEQTAADEERRRRDAWERCRTAAAFSIYPHLKRGASRKAADIFPLPWDGEEGKKKRPAPAVSREEAHKRFERLIGH